MKIERRNTKIAEYWAKIPVKGRRGGVWVAIKPHCPIEPDMEICESKLLKHNGDFYLHVVVQKEVEEPTLNPKRILAVDLGERYMATTVEYINGKICNPKFYGKNVRGIRRHFAWLRRRLGERKLLKVIKRLETKRKEKLMTSSTKFQGKQSTELRKLRLP